MIIIHQNEPPDPSRYALMLVTCTDMAQRSHTRRVQHSPARGESLEVCLALDGLSLECAHHDAQSAGRCAEDGGTSRTPSPPASAVGSPPVQVERFTPPTLRGASSGILGMVTSNTPSANLASVCSGMAFVGSSKRRLKA